jgi:hypothetical protein
MASSSIESRHAESNEWMDGCKKGALTPCFEAKSASPS